MICNDYKKHKDEYIGTKINGIEILDLYKGVSNQTYGKLKCSCGKIFNASISNIVNKTTSSCGCLNRRNKKEDRHLVIWKRKYNKLRATHNERFDEKLITLEEFIKLSGSNCHYCGAKPSVIAKDINERRRGKLHSDCTVLSNGLDRIDSSKGYIDNNINPSCKTCNHAKNSLPIKDFYSWIKNIAKFQKKRGLIK